MQSDLVTAPFDRRTIVSTGDVRLVADIGGPERAPVVVLMHGGGQTRHSWSGAMTALVRRGYRVINFDARGHGDSSWSRDGAYDLDDRVDDLFAIIGDAAPFALVGASLGGGTAIHAAAKGLRPSAVILVDIVPHPEPEGITRIVNFMGRHTDGFASLEEATDAVAAYNPERPRPNDPNGLMRNLRQSTDGRLHWHWDPRILEDTPGTSQAKVLESANVMAQIQDLPVLVVRGLKSDVVSSAGIERFRDLMPQLEVADVSGAGHMVAGDRNDAFNAAVIAFLEVHMPCEPSS